MLNILAFDSAVNIFLVIILIVLAVLLIYLAKRSIKKAKTDIIEHDKNFEFDSEKFNIMISRKISSDKKANFTIFQIEIQDLVNLKKSYGDMQYENAVSSLINELKKILGFQYKIFQYEEGNVLIYSKYNLSGDHLKEISKKIIIECQKTIVLAGALTMEIDVNIGIVSFPGCGNSIKEIKQNLLIALIGAKRKGYNTFSVYNAELGNKNTDEYKNYLEIKNAINNKEFILYYQPIVDLNNMEVNAAEALLRWEHKTQGTLSPASFLNIMEKSGDINWVGFWSLEQLIKQTQIWKNQYPDINLLLTMNLSPKQLMNPELSEELRRIIKRYRINTNEFCMEIIQFAVFDKVKVVEDNITKLSQMGFRIAIDNFGMEFSTLQILDKFKIDYIKLDRKFLKETSEKELSKSIAEMLIKYAGEKNIKIIAEGVENAELLNYIKTLGINYGQGYYFSKPKKPKELMQDVILTPWKE
jgi:EAL domain-containing protein (putative c-di-GMP-specific phosphodiesterase class I)